MRLFAVLATLLSDAERDDQGRRAIPTDALVDRLRSLHHSSSAIEWTVYHGRKQGYFEISSLMRLEQRSVRRYAIETRQHQAIVQALAATDVLWQAWRSGNLTADLLSPSEQSTPEQGAATGELGSGVSSVVLDRGPETPSDKSLLLALSGGGLRATMFHLGVMIYLHEIGRLRDVSGIVSVSGGSILSAHFVKKWMRATEGPAAFREVATELVQFARSDLRNRVLISWLWTRLLPWQWLNAWGLTSWLEYAYRAQFGETTLGNLENEGIPSIAIVATDAIRQERVVFTSKWILRLPIDAAKSDQTSNLVVTLSSGVWLSLAVAASSCFPPVFRRMRVTSADLGLHFSEFKDVSSLNDGGVAGNLAVKAMLSLRAHGYQSGANGVSCDAERPLWENPERSILVDPNTQSAAISQSERDDFVRAFGDHGIQVRLSERVPETIGLPFRVQTLVGRFRTDLDAPSLQEIHALLIHGASAAAVKLMADDVVNVMARCKVTISEILKRESGRASFTEPSEADLRFCHRRPLLKPILHLIVFVAVILCLFALGVLIYSTVAASI